MLKCVRWLGGKSGKGCRTHLGGFYGALQWTASQPLFLERNRVLVNRQEKITKTTGQILKENICTLFNLLNLIIAIALICVQAWSNLFFIAIIALNTSIGIIQEIKAKRLIEKLSLLSAPKATVERNGEAMQIDITEIALEDILLLESGNQICADAVVQEGTVEVNESLLTGESDAILKKPGDSLLSGSSIISGKCRAQVIHVGDDNYASKIAKEAKKSKALSSELVLSMRKVTKLTGFIIIPLGILLLVQALFLRDNDMYEAVVSTSAGLLGMLPKGLYLLISIGLAAGIIALSRKNVLVQDLYSLENLAHVDVLCLDKTGTLTEGRMQVEKTILFPGANEAVLKEYMGSFLTHTSDNNATFQAMNAYFARNEVHTMAAQTPFSSDRKWSAMTFEDGQTLVVGAPEKLSAKALPDDIQACMQAGKRVLLVGLTKESMDKSAPLPPLDLLAAVTIVDPIRKNASAAMDYFRGEGVAVKIISGDNPVTVSAIAAQAGVPGAEHYIDMSQLDENVSMTELAEQYSVFGRVTPVQKRQLVDALHQNQHKVAMTGDGVNDLLALKEADCSIAVGQGSDAARQVAQLVLLDSDFSVLKDVLMQGRRVVNNVTKSAGVFFIKTLYSILLCFICLLTNTPFPFIPIQITLIDLMIEGYPAFFASFEPNAKKVDTRFLPEAIRRAAPNALAFTCCFVIYLVLYAFGILGETGENTQANAILYLLIGTIGIMGVWKMCMPWNKLRAFLSISTTVFFYGAIAVLLFCKDHILHLDILHMAVPSATSFLFLIGFVVLSFLLERIFACTLFRHAPKSKLLRL